MRASVFVPRSREGLDLLGLIEPILEARGFEVEAPDATAWRVIRSVNNDDVVILDVSVEIENIYPAIGVQAMVLRHVLLVSRTHLPQNLVGISGVGAPRYPRQQTNREILPWLCSRLSQLELPRPLKGAWNYLRAMKHSLDQPDGEQQEFLSYRSGSSSAERADRQEIIDGLGEIAPRAHYYRPGELAFENELLTEAGHWHVASILARQIRRSSGFLVLNTPDYLGSWWTRVELMALAEHGADRLSLATIGPAGRSEGLPVSLPSLTRSQRQRWDRWMANTDARLSAPHSAAVMTAARSRPLLRRAPYFDDHVWSETFRLHPLLRCPAYVASNSAHGVDVESDLWIGDLPGTTALTPEEMDVAAKRGGLPCPRCGQEVAISQEAPRYLWYWDDAGLHSAPKRGSVVSEPVYLATHERSAA